MSLAICGLGIAQPDRSIAQPAAAEIAKAFVGGGERKDRALEVLFKRTRVNTRGSVILEGGNGSDPEQSFYWPAAGPDDRGPGTGRRMERYAREAVPLALNASRRAITAAGISASTITHAVTVSCTGFFAPGIDVALIRQLNLAPTIGRLNVGFMGCHGVLNGLRSAQSIVDADPSAVVLLCAVELCSLHFQYGQDRQKMVANALFADGAAALVGRSPEKCEPGGWRVVGCGSYLMPDKEDGMTWRVGDHGFEMTLSPRVPHLIAEHLRPWLEAWLAKSGLTLAEIGSWAIHPGGPRILSSVAEALGLAPDATETSARVLAECGNMSSPTVLFVLDRLQRANAARPCVALAFGPGLVAEAALIE